MNLDKIILIGAAALLAISVVNLIAGNLALAVGGAVISAIVVAVITSPE